MYIVSEHPPAKPRIVVAEKGANRQFFEQMRFIYNTGRDSYVYASLTQKVDGDVLYAAWSGLDVYEQYFSKQTLKTYIKKRGLPNPEGRQLIDKKKSSYDGHNAVIFVKAGLSGGDDAWKNERTHTVHLGNVTNSAYVEDRVDTMRKFRIFCSCDFTRMLKDLTPPKSKRMEAGDYSSRKKVDVSALLDTHVAIGGHHVVRYGRAFDMAILGYTPHTIDIGARFVERVVRSSKNDALSQYMLNLKYSKMQAEMFRPFAEMLSNYEPIRIV